MVFFSFFTQYTNTQLFLNVCAKHYNFALVKFFKIMFFGYTWLKNKRKVLVCREGVCVGVLRLCAAGVVLQWPWTQSSSCDAGGWWASRPHLTRSPTSGKRRETLRSWGGVFRNRREEHTGNKTCLGMWEEDSGVQCDREFRWFLNTALQAPILFFKGFLWDFTPRSHGIESTCFWKRG